MSCSRSSRDNLQYPSTYRRIDSPKARAPCKMEAHSQKVRLHGFTSCSIDFATFAAYKCKRIGTKDTFVGEIVLRASYTIIEIGVRTGGAQSNHD